MITGTQAADNLSGTAGDDAIEGLGGNDTLHGGGGTDTAVFAGNAAGYTMGLVGGALLVTDVDPSDGDTGTDRLDGFEWLQFGDRRYGLPQPTQVASAGEVRVDGGTAFVRSNPDASGSYVVVWQSQGQDGDDSGIYMQRYDGSGVPLGPETRVNSTVAGSQSSPTVVRLPQGGFVVAWQASGQDGSGQGIYAQVFDAAGGTVGVETRVNTTTLFDQTAPQVLGLPGDAYVVVWQTRDASASDADAGGFQIMAQRFAGSGEPLGGEVVLVADAGVAEPLPVLTPIASHSVGVGDYAVTWSFSREGPDGVMHHGIRLQYFNADGTTHGEQRSVVDVVAEGPLVPAVTAVISPLGDEFYVVTWASPDGDIFARHVDNNNPSLGPIFRVNTTTEGIQTDPAIAKGGFGYIVVWQSEGQDGSGQGIFAQLFDFFGSAVGAQIQVNTTTAFDQLAPSVSGDDGYTVTWRGALTADGSHYGIYRQQINKDGSLEGIEITGTASADVIQGGIGPQTLFGDGGDDTLDGGSGPDYMEGGWHNDVYIVDNAADQVREFSGSYGGIDTVRSAVDFALGDYFENLELTGAALAGTGNTLANRITGNALANVLRGGRGDDTLSGGAGADMMVGGVGDDVYIVHDSDDVIAEARDAGVDTVYSFVTRTLGKYQNHLRLAGDANIDGTGNEDDNLVTGNVANNRLDGAAGADSMQGGNGHDTLIGGTGDDTMRGGFGNDSYFVDSAADRVVEAVDAGVDTVYSSLASLVLGAAVENGRIMSTGAANMTGNALDNLIYAGRGNNVIAAGDGVDTVSYAYGVNGAAGVTVSLADTASQVTGGSGVDRITGFEKVIGSANADRLTGNAGSNVLDGGAGADTLAGGGGNDSYFVDDRGDLVAEAAGEGQDTVFSTRSSYALTDWVENGRILAQGTAGMTGNALGNLIYAGIGNNVLSGGEGTDTLSYAYGIAGSQGVTVSLGTVGQQDSRGSGMETVSGFENLVGSGAGDTLLGNKLANILTGGLGRDLLRGGAGNDIFDYNAVADSGVDAGSRDVITDFVRGDRIDLSTLDADAAAAGNQAFTRIIAGTSDFTAAGQLKLSDGILYGNTDGDEAAEFAIGLTGVTSLTAADFIL